MNIEIFYKEWHQDWSETQLAALGKELPPRELAKIMQYRSARERQMRLAGKLMLLQWCRDQQLHKSLEALHYTPDNKPLLPGLSFSIAHAGNFTLCALATTGLPLGIDIEPIRHIDPALLEDYYSEQEWRTIADAPQPHVMLLQLWTRKEALLKANGRGMNTDLADIDVCADRVRTQDKEYYLHNLQPDEKHCGALAVAAAEVAISWISWEA